MFNNVSFISSLYGPISIKMFEPTGTSSEEITFTFKENWQNNYCN